MLEELLEPTQKEFFEHWSKEDLIKECVRLNQVLVECLKIIRR